MPDNLDFLVDARSYTVKGNETAAYDHILYFRDRKQTEWSAHPLGFFVCKRVINDQLTVRMHVWPSDWSIPEDQVNADTHDHVFDLHSLVVLGTIYNEIFDIKVDALGNYLQYKISYKANSSGVDSNGNPTPVRMIRTGRSIYSTGQIYHLEKGNVHRGGLVQGPAVTLVAAVQKFAGGSPRIIVQGPGGVPPSFERRPPSADEWTQIQRVVGQALLTYSSPPT